jgi:hypothetical protein
MKIFFNMQYSILINILKMYTLALVGFLAIINSVVAAPSIDHSDGFVDAISYDNGRLVAQGWVGAAKATQQIVAIVVTIDGRNFYQGGFERIQRPDVVKATGRQDWLRSGWKITTKIDDELTVGPHHVLIQAVPDSGARINLINSPQADAFKVDTDFTLFNKSINFTKAVLTVASLFIFVVFIYSDFLSLYLFKGRLRSEYIFALSLFLGFLITVGLGISGSSIDLGIKQTPFVKSDMKRLWGVDQPIRSDEWLVLTPLAISQFNQIPKNPVINKSHGEDGQNMLIVGMTGVPVAHISEIAKPATWGFFIFGLSSALAWDWCFPFFGCLLSLWAVMCVLAPNQWRTNFLAALLFNLSPYIVGWSHWPAYATFFPCCVFLCALKLTEIQGRPIKLLTSLALGISFAGFVFILYPPWQVSLGYVFIAVTTGIIIRDKIYKRFTLELFAFYIVSLIVAAALIAAWWLDAKPAIEAMENTVYPGQRTTVTGGNLSLPFLLRGFTNIETMRSLTSPLSNQSEISSFYYLLAPLLISFIIAAYRKTLDALQISMSVAVVFILSFMTVGIPEIISKYTLWGRVPSNRADLGLGLSTLILSVLLLSKIHSTYIASVRLKLLAVLTSSFWAYIVYNNIYKLDDSITEGLNTGTIFAVIIITTVMGYLLVIGKTHAFLYFNIGLAFSTTAAINPISIAPNSVTNTVRGLPTVGLLNTDRLLLLNNMIPSMYLEASGEAISNGIFYYPQTALWKRLDPSGSRSDIYNRYQHLFYSSETENDTLPYVITTPQPDVVRINVSNSKFDFSLSGANILIAPISEDENLNKNTKLKHLHSSDGWSWYRIN